MAPSQSVAQLHASALNELASSASVLRRIILEAEPKIGSIDEFSLTNYRGEWQKNRTNYNDILDASDTAASKLSAIIKYYLSFQGNINEPGATDDMIEELTALDGRLKMLHFDQSADMVSLKNSFQLLVKNLSVAVNDRKRSVEGELNATEAEVTALRKQLADCPPPKSKKDDEDASSPARSRPMMHFVTTFVGLKSGGKAKAEETIEEIVPEAHGKPRAESTDESKKTSSGKESKQSQYRDLHNKLDAAQARQDEAIASAQRREGIERELDAVLQTELDIRRKLELQTEQLQLLPNLSDQLGKEVSNYLAAFQNVKADPSTENQRAMANMHRKVEHGSGRWKDVATLLGDVYARKQK